MLVNCQVCNAEFKAIPSDVKRGVSKYCSRDCMGVASRRKVDRTCLGCGKAFDVVPSTVSAGSGKFCTIECSRKNSTRTHGESSTKIYYAWNSMVNRCTNEKHPQFRIYGKRGITVCAEWRESYEAFRDWALVNGYSDNLEIDRRDCNGNYCPANCRWITHAQNDLNKRGNPHKKGSKYKGVHLEKRTKAKTWCAAITLNGKRHCLGTFKTEEEAARAYDAKAKELHGEYAHFNFPDEATLVEKPSLF